MPDILIRDIPEDALARLDAAARRAGLSRAEYVRRLLVAQRRPDRDVTVDDLRRFDDTFADARDPDIMRGAWE